MSLVSSRKPFGLPTNFDSNLIEHKDYLKVFANKKTLYIDNKMIAINRDWIKKHKIIVPKAIGTGNSCCVIKPIIHQILFAETYILIGPLKTKIECDNLITYINTIFIFYYLKKLLKIQPKCL